MKRQNIYKNLIKKTKGICRAARQSLIREIEEMAIKRKRLIKQGNVPDKEGLIRALENGEIPEQGIHDFLNLL